MTLRNEKNKKGESLIFIAHKSVLRADDLYDILELEDFIDCVPSRSISSVFVRSYCSSLLETLLPPPPTETLLIPSLVPLLLVPVTAHFLPGLSSSSLWPPNPLLVPIRDPPYYRTPPVTCTSLLVL